MVTRVPSRRPATTASVMLSTPPLTATAAAPIPPSTVSRLAAWRSIDPLIALPLQGLRLGVLASPRATRMTAGCGAQRLDLGLGGTGAIRPGDPLDRQRAVGRRRARSLRGRAPPRLDPPAQPDRRGLGEAARDHLVAAAPVAPGSGSGSRGGPSCRRRATGRRRARRPARAAHRGRPPAPRRSDRRPRRRSAPPGRRSGQLPPAHRRARAGRC